MSVSRETVFEFIEAINNDHVRDVADQELDFSTFLVEALEKEATEKQTQTQESSYHIRKNSKYNSISMVR